MIEGWVCGFDLNSTVMRGSVAHYTAIHPYCVSEAHTNVMETNTRLFLKSLEAVPTPYVMYGWQGFFYFDCDVLHLLLLYNV